MTIIPNKLPNKEDPLFRNMGMWLTFPVAYFLPKMLISTQNEFIDLIIKLISDIIPSIQLWVNLSPFPILTRVLFSIIWLEFLYFTYLFITTKKYEDAFMEHFSNKFLRGIFLIILLIFVLYKAIFDVLIQLSACLVCYNSNYFSQVFMAWIIGMSSGACIAILYWAIKYTYKSIKA